LAGRNPVSAGVSALAKAYVYFSKVAFKLLEKINNVKTYLTKRAEFFPPMRMTMIIRPSFNNREKCNLCESQFGCYKVLFLFAEKQSCFAPEYASKI